MNKKRWPLILIALGLLYRLIFVLYGKLEIPHSDALWYDELARNILNLHRYSVNGQPFAFYTPGYPIFLASLYSIFGQSNFLVVRLTQAVLSSLSLWLIYTISIKTVGRNKALIALGLSAVYFPFIYANGFILTESLYTLIFLLWILLSIDSKNHFLTGIVWGVMLLIRPISALWLMALYLIRFILNLRKIQSKDWSFVPKFKDLIAITAGVVVIMSPWIVRNAIVFKRFIPLSAESGNVLLQGSYVGYKYDRSEWPVGKDEIETDNLKFKFAISKIVKQTRDNPIKYGLWIAEKVYIFFDQSYTNVQRLFPPLEWQRNFHRAIVILAFLGLIVGLKQKSTFSLFGLFFMSYLTVFHTIFMTLDRLALPSMYIVIVNASVGIWSLRKYFKYLPLIVVSLLASSLAITTARAYVTEELSIFDGQIILKAIDKQANVQNKLEFFVNNPYYKKVTDKKILIGVNDKEWTLSLSDVPSGWVEFKLNKSVDVDCKITIKTLGVLKDDGLKIGVYKYKNYGWSDFNKTKNGSYMIKLNQYPGSEDVEVRQRLIKYFYVD